MICFGQICADENAPLYLVDELIKLLKEEYECGLWIEDMYIHGRKSFIQHLLKQFQSPKLHLLHIGIESLHLLGID